ncbi:hypothetical protein TWF281_004833 [Arthrobotrys megalospora]
MSRAFPAVQFLRFDACYNGRDLPHLWTGRLLFFKSLQRFKKLRTARIPWPYNANAMNNPDGGIVTSITLRQNAEYLAGHGSRLENLESLEYVKYYEPVNDTMYYTYNHLIPTGRDMEVLLLQRGEDGTWQSRLKVEPGNRRNNYMFQDRRWFFNAPYCYINGERAFQYTRQSAWR